MSNLVKVEICCGHVKYFGGFDLAVFLIIK